MKVLESDNAMHDRGLRETMSVRQTIVCSAMGMEGGLHGRWLMVRNARHSKPEKRRRHKRKNARGDFGIDT